MGNPLAGDQDDDRDDGEVVKRIEIEGVWLLKSPGGTLRVIVEVEGRLRECIADDCEGGPISYYVHPAGIGKGRDVTEEFTSERSRSPGG